MAITFSSYMAAATAIFIASGILLLIMRKDLFMTKLGWKCVYIFSWFVLLRGILPVEFYGIHLTKTIYSYKVIPFVKEGLKTKLINNEYFEISCLQLLLLIYVCGLIIHLYRSIRAYYETGKYIASIPKIEDQKIMEAFQKAWGDVIGKKKCNIRIVCSDKFNSPAIWCMRNPAIILPVYEYSEEDYYYIFSHELLHFKFKDFVCKAAMEILPAFYWWIPFVSKILFECVSQIQELRVDYYFTHKKEEAIKAKYMEILTKTLHFQRETSMITMTKEVHALLNYDSEQSIKKRFESIIIKDRKRFSVVGMAICICLVFMSYTVVFEARYRVKTDEDGNRVYEDINGQTYYKKNGAKYDLYMENEYVGTFDKIHEVFKDVPVYNQ